MSEVIVGMISTRMMYERPLAAHPGGGKEIAGAQRQSLRAQLPGLEGPAGEASARRSA